MIRALLCWFGRHEWTDWLFVQGETDLSMGLRRAPAVPLLPGAAVEGSTVSDEELPETAECSVLTCTAEGRLYVVHGDDPENKRLGYLCPRHLEMVNG